MECRREKRTKVTLVSRLSFVGDPLLARRHDQDSLIVPLRCSYHAYRWFCDGLGSSSQGGRRLNHPEQLAFVFCGLEFSCPHEQRSSYALGRSDTLHTLLHHIHRSSPVCRHGLFSRSDCSVGCSRHHTTCLSVHVRSWSGDSQTQIFCSATCTDQ